MPNYSLNSNTSKTTMYSSLKLEDYDISETNGFLPTHAPLTRLPDSYYEPWEKIMDKFNQHLLANRIRPLVRKVSVPPNLFNPVEKGWNKQWYQQLVGQSHTLRLRACLQDALPLPNNFLID
ncbi:tryptophan 2,3- dioxygenase [Linderina macrospora]|uniref:Tryptophan 2,3- dioxygenase n=1 Tax=Linderina macrospora TaxID=4868 RepID=A0ACC1J4R6_9FUNG|nr:tryptophan 2,3- dioxygenase [Linderina macrospora]